MNARVDPATLQAPKPGDDDAALISLCRAAGRAIDLDIELDKAVNELEDKIEKELPPYPRLGHWADNEFCEAQMSAKRLRALLEERRQHGDFYHSAAEWQAMLRRQIPAVLAWERACSEICRNLGQAKLHRRYERAMEQAQAYTLVVADTAAVTVEGVAQKSLLVPMWLIAGYEIGDGAGEKLVMSILEDVRRLGATSNGCGKTKRIRRAT